MPPRRSLRWLALPACLAAAPVQVKAAPPPRTVSATAADVFALAELALRRGQRDQAQRLLALLGRDPNAEVRNEARFRHALLLETDDRYKDAAVLLRQILDERPDAAPVRLKLASLLQQLGDEDSALRELRALRSSSLPTTVARFVDRLSASLQATKPFGVQLEVAVAPNSNINRVTNSETVGTIFGDFAIDEEARSGIGAAVRGMAQARVELADRVTIAARASGEASLYRDSRFNDIAIGVSAGPEVRLGRTRLAAEAGVVQQWYGMEPYQRSLRLSGSVTQPVGAVTQLRFEADARWTDDRVNDPRDGSGLSARVRVERALSPQLAVALHATADRYRAADAAYSTRSWSAGVAAQRDIGRMTVSAAGEIGRLKADERLALLPKAREDRLTRVSLGAVFRQLTVAGFAPMSRITIERNRSTVEFHDYRQTRTEFGVSRAF